MTDSTQTTPSLKKAWLDAARPRTLPLALSCIALGTFLAAADAAYSWLITTLCLVTAVFLQILSNLANDYGDSIHGADHMQREGPQRAVQSGQITAATMRRAMFLFAGLSAVTGLALVWLAWGDIQSAAAQAADTDNHVVVRIDVASLGNAESGTLGAFSDREASLREGLWSPRALRAMRRNWCGPGVRPIRLEGTFRDTPLMIADLCAEDAALPRSPGVLGFGALFPDYLRFRKNMTRACSQQCVH